MNRAKYPRAKVTAYKDLGAGVFRYELSCGHITDRVGITRRGTAMEGPAATCTCYRCHPDNPYFDYLRSYWLDGYEGRTLVACTGDEPIEAWQQGLQARKRHAALARVGGAK